MVSKKRAIRDSPRAFGYGRNYSEDTFHRLRSAAFGRKFDWQGMECENFKDEPFLERRRASAIAKQMQPGEWLFASRFEDIFNDADDCIRTYRWFKVRKLELYIIACNRLSPENEDDRIVKMANYYATLHKDQLWTPKKENKQRWIVGWHRTKIGLAPDVEQRLAAMRILDYKINHNLSFGDIAKLNEKEKFWPGVLTDLKTRKIFQAAKERFPGPDGELEEAIEGTGI